MNSYCTSIIAPLATAASLFSSGAVARTLCSPLNAQLCLDTSQSIQCGAPEAPSSVLQSLNGTWSLTVRGKPMLSAHCEEAHHRVNCLYGPLFLNIDLTSIVENSESSSTVTVSGSEGGAFLGIPYAQPVTCRGARI